MVAASNLVHQLLETSNSLLVPVDSEHNSLFQCFRGRDRSEIERVTITASGGPFLDTPFEQFANITAEQASNHPNWSMGKKISIDSATLMNKGLEVIEAATLFNLSADIIDVLVHPQSIIHGLVEFREGTSIAALYHPDMRIPIRFALDYIGNLVFDRNNVYSSTDIKKLDLDTDRFPCLSIAYEALRRGGSAPLIVNASNEVAVDAFCNEEISFIDIPKVIEATMNNSSAQDPSSIEEIIKLDSTTRICASEVVEEISRKNSI
ncbi:UNVERIFIED_CONTAM: hypothetical protein GTU68_059406 [Idotea baltica]|nr:hypothetical protein [Idotea baltica]